MLPIPIGDDQVHNGYTPFFSRLFIAICVCVFVFQYSLPQGMFASFITAYGTVPAEIMSGQDLFTLITNMFLHGSWMHLLGNMLYLYVFGDNIEATIGNAKYVLFYIAGGIVASLAHIFLSPDSLIPAVGASGAISAVLGAYLVLFPKAKVKVMYLNRMKTDLRPASYFLVIYIGLQLVSGVGAIGSIGGGTARRAHIGGFAFGRVMGYVFKISKAGEVER